jgi:hypothetical protein
MLLQPFVIVALAHPINGEPVQLRTFAYAAAVVLAVLIGQRTRAQTSASCGNPGSRRTI